MKKDKGTTVFEVLVTIALAALLLGAAAPNLRSYKLKQESDTAAREILRHLTKARELAVFSGKEVLFCGVDDNMKCTRDKIKKFVVFVDENGDRKVNQKEKIEFELAAEFDGSLHLRASSRAGFIRYHNDGRAHPYGSFYLCPKKEDKYLIRRISANMSGRSYVARPLEKGLVAHVDKKPINCNALPEDEPAL
jgi:type IV fimbrial biogenesis protein FimT